VVAERGRKRDFVTAGVALESVSDNVQLLAAPWLRASSTLSTAAGARHGNESVTAWPRSRSRSTPAS
jgi:hypothetical protein